jgi:hypothetical protein
MVSLSGYRTSFLTLTLSRAYKSLMAITSTVALRFGSRWDSWSHYCFFHALTCFRMGPPVWREEGTWLLLTTLPLLWSDCCHYDSVGRSVKLLLGFASTVSQLESPRDPIPRILFSPRHVRVARWRLFFHGVGVCLIRRRYLCYAAVSAQIYPRSLGVQVTVQSVHTLSLHYNNI